MENEIQEREEKLQIQMSPADKLNALLTDPELAWLRVLSQMLSAIDEIYFQKEDISIEQVESSQKNVVNLMIEPNDSVFNQKYRSLLPFVPDLMPHHGLLLGVLKKKSITKW